MRPLTVSRISGRPGPSTGEPVLGPARYPPAVPQYVCSVPGAALLVGQEGRDPGQRGVPVDRDLVRRPGTDVVDVAELGRTAVLEQRGRDRVTGGRGGGVGSTGNG